MKHFIVKALIAALVLFLPLSALAIESNELSVGGLIAGGWQYQSVNDAPGFEDTDRGAVVFQPEISLQPTENDEFFTKFAFAAGNGLNDGTSPFVVAPWAANLEQDLKDINGRNRDYLLTAWYKHTFKYSDSHSLGLTGGIIDATDYVDENAYANDEYTQFMNEALVNGPNAFLPSYDIGGAFQWQIGGFAMTGVGMGIGENDDGNNFNFYSVQLAYTAESGLGEGNYRVMINTTTDGFSNPLGTEFEKKTSLLFSFDQQFGKAVGLWTRLGWQDDKAAINYEAIYSGGIDIFGSLWNRENDNIGIGYAYIEGGNLDIDKSQVFEIYYRLAFNEYFALTADLQYIKDDYRNDPTFNPDGVIAGLRAVAEF